MVLFSYDMVIETTVGNVVDFFEILTNDAVALSPLVWVYVLVRFFFKSIGRVPVPPYVVVPTKYVVLLWSVSVTLTHPVPSLASVVSRVLLERPVKLYDSVPHSLIAGLA